ncbi:hypothetical protein ACA910_001939 [Epithemia clementina (nom. ined.)]
MQGDEQEVPFVQELKQELEEPIREIHHNNQAPKTHISVETVAENEADDNISSLTTETPRIHNVTRSGRIVRPPRRLIEELGLGGVDYDRIELTTAEQNFYQAMAELEPDLYASNTDEQHDIEQVYHITEDSDQAHGITFDEYCAYANNGFMQDYGEIMSTSNIFCCVGAGLGGGIQNTQELHVLNYKEAMQTPDRDKWQQAVEEEYDRMIANNVFIPCPRSEVPPGSKILTSTWAMKKKANGVYRGRINAKGFQQKDGEHYDSHATFAPVVAEMTVMIVFTLIIMANWLAWVLDVKGAFLHGDFEKGRKIYMEIPEGMKHKYPPWWVVLLNKTLYGTKQAAKQFWLKVLEAMRAMGFLRNRADPCLYWAWTKWGLILWMSWIDDFVVCGKPEGVRQAIIAMKEQFDCDDCGELNEYIGCKVDINRHKRFIKLTQPVLIRSFNDEFQLPTDTHNTPSPPGEVLEPSAPEEQLNHDEQKIFRSGVGKLLHLMKWSRPDILNSVRELSRFMKVARLQHLRTMLRCMKYCSDTAKRGRVLRPDCTWDGTPNFEFTISGRGDSDFAKDSEKRRSVTGSSVFLNGAVISASSRMQDSTTLSVSESELIAGVETAQKMLFAMRVLEDMGLKVKKPMKLEMDCQGALSLAHNWSSSGRTRHIDVKYHFLRELKELGLIMPVWMSTASNTSDMFTENLPGPQFNKFLPTYCTDEGVPTEMTTIHTVDCGDQSASRTTAPNDSNNSPQMSIFEDPNNMQLRDTNGDNPKKKADDNPSQHNKAANSATCVEPNMGSETALVVWKPLHTINEVTTTNGDDECPKQ